VRIILPEGVSNIELSTPYPVERKEDVQHFTYLDTAGYIIRTAPVLR
jgi:hypothetical protein